MEASDNRVFGQWEMRKASRAKFKTSTEDEGDLLSERGSRTSTDVKPGLENVQPRRSSQSLHSRKSTVTEHRKGCLKSIKLPFY